MSTSRGRHKDYIGSVFYSSFFSSVPTSTHTHTQWDCLYTYWWCISRGIGQSEARMGDTRPGQAAAAGPEHHRHRRKWLLIFCVAHGFSVFSVLLCSRCAATPPSSYASACCSFFCCCSSSCSCSCTLVLGLVSGAKCLHKGLRQTKLNQQQRQQAATSGAAAAAATLQTTISGVTKK